MHNTFVTEAYFDLRWKELKNVDDKCKYVRTGSESVHTVPVSFPSDRKCSRERTRLRMNMLESTMFLFTVVTNFSNCERETFHL